MKDNKFKMSDDLEKEMEGLLLYIGKRFSMFSDFSKEIVGALRFCLKNPKGIDVKLLGHIALQARMGNEIIDKVKFPLDVEFLQLISNLLLRVVEWTNKEACKYN